MATNNNKTEGAKTTNQPTRTAGATDSTVENKTAANGQVPQTDFQKAYALEDQRLADVQKTQSEQDPITDEKAIKTDGTDNINADKSLKTTEAQLSGVKQEVRDGIVEQPNLNRTAEEQLGLANPDNRLAEELREAKVSGNVPQDGKK